MKTAVILGLALAGLAVAGEVRPPAPAAGQILRGVKDTPRLGLTVGRLDDVVRAHVPELPAGIGFVVAQVEPGGPADQAGVKAYDVLWKLGDQWLANEAQLFTLLRLKKEGDEVALGLYRSGEALTLPVVLARPSDKRVLGSLPEAAAEKPRDAPMKVLRPADRSAEIEAADGKAVLSLVNGRPEVRITSTGGSVVYEGPVSDADGTPLVPDPWKPRVGALQRALAHAIGGARPPRTRLLPAAEEER